jgi:signal transduction histidine kinase
MLGEELASNARRRSLWCSNVAVEGESQDLHALVRDEIFKIAAEALRNAFRHARARRVEVEIRYDGRRFCLHVRDDGKGMDAALLAPQGRVGHFGLPGIQETLLVHWFDGPPSRA